MTIVPQELSSLDNDQLEPLNFNIDQTNQGQVQFWNQAYSLAWAAPSFEFSTKLKQRPDITGGIVLHELALRFHLDTTSVLDPSDVTEQFMAWITKGNPVIQETIWANASMKTAILDALLTKRVVDAKKGLDSSKQKTAEEGRRLLRLPDQDFAAPFYVGTSTAALIGIERANATILSISRQEELRVARRTGEGIRGGASADSVRSSGVSVSTLFETADAWSDLSSTVYHQTPQKAASEFERINELIVYWQEVLSKPEKIMYGHIDARDQLELLFGSRSVTESQLRSLRLATVPLGKRAEVFPIIFGVRDINLQREEKNDLRAWRSDHEIPLREKLDKVYVPTDKMEDIKQRLEAMGIVNSNVLPLEAVRLIREFDPVLRKARNEVWNTAGKIKRTHQR